MLGIVAEVHPGDYEVWENRQTSRSPPNEPDATSVASLHARAHRMFEDERMRLRDTISFERQHPPTREHDGRLMPPVPEPSNHTSLEERERELRGLLQIRRDLRAERRGPAPTPPYTESDLTFMARIGTHSARPASHTPALSPPRRPNAGDPESSRTSGALSRLQEMSGYSAEESPVVLDVSIIVF